MEAGVGVQQGGEGRSGRLGPGGIGAEGDYVMEQYSSCEKCERSTFPTFSSCVFSHFRGWKVQNYTFQTPMSFCHQEGGSEVAPTLLLIPWFLLTSVPAESELFMILKDSGALGGPLFCSMVLKAIPENAAWCLHPPE